MTDLPLPESESDQSPAKPTASGRSGPTRYFVEDLNPNRIWLGLLNRLRDKGVLDQQDIQDILVGAAIENLGAAPDEELPRLRKWVVVARLPDGNVLVEDPIFWRSYAFSPAAKSFLTRLDGRTTPAELKRDLQEEGIDLDETQIDEFLLRLDSLDLLQNERTEERVEAALDREKAFRGQSAIRIEEEVAESDDLELVFMDGARYQCFACGSSCTYPFPLGPISDEERTAIEAHDWSDIYGDFDEFFQEGARVDEEGHARRTNYLAKTEEGACVFLDTDGKCRVHKHMGVEYKPYACRKWPFSFFKVRDTLVVSTRYRCFDKFHFTESRLVAEDAPEIQKLVTGRSFESAPESIPLEDGLEVSLDDYLALERTWLELFASGPGSIFDRIETGGRLLDRLTEALRTEPESRNLGVETLLERAEMTETLEAEPRPGRWAVPWPDDLADLVLGFYRHFYRTYVMSKGGDELLRTFCTFFFHLLSRLTRIDAEELLCVAVEPGEPLPIESVAFDATEPRIAGTLRYYHMNHLWAKRLLEFSSIRKGYAVMAFHALLQRSYTTHLAAAEGASEATPEQLARAMEFLEHMRERAILGVLVGQNRHLDTFIQEPGFARRLLARRPAPDSTPVADA